MFGRRTVFGPGLGRNPEEPWPASKTLTVLLAEDDGDLRSMLSAALRRDGHRVFEMRDGADLHDDLTLLFLDDYRIPNNLFWCSSPLRLPGVLDHAVAEAGGAPDCR